MKKNIVKYSCSRYATLAIFLDMLPEAERRIVPEELATNPAMPPMEQDEAGRWFVTSFSYARWAEIPAGQVTYSIRGAIAALSEEAAEAAFTLLRAPVQTSGRRVMNREHYRISLYGVLVLSERSRKPRTRLAADAVWKYLRPDVGCSKDAEIVPFPDSDVSDDIDENDDFLDEAPAPYTRRRPSYSLDDDLKDAPVVRPAPDGRLYVTAGLLADAIGSSLDELRTEIEGIEYGDPAFFKKHFKSAPNGDFYLSTAATVLLGVSCGQTLAQKIDIINAATVSPAV